MGIVKKAKKARVRSLRRRRSHGDSIIKFPYAHVHGPRHWTTPAVMEGVGGLTGKDASRYRYVYKR